MKEETKEMIRTYCDETIRFMGAIVAVGSLGMFLMVLAYANGGQ